MRGEYLSPHNKFCDGAQVGNHYMAGVKLSIGITEKKFDTANIGNTELDDINAFDIAEAGGLPHLYTQHVLESDAYMGQINVVTVSSFPEELWGLDFARAVQEFTHHPVLGEEQSEIGSENIPVRSALPLRISLKELFGTNDKRYFPLYPSSLVYCANKSSTIRGPSEIIAAIGIGLVHSSVASGGDASNIFMETTCHIPLDTYSPQQRELIKRDFLYDLAKSVLTVSVNQKSSCETILVDMISREVSSDQIGCALVIAPYFVLARQAVPKEGIEALRTMTLDQWKTDVRDPQFRK
jgi:histidine decarboxylase